MATTLDDAAMDAREAMDGPLVGVGRQKHMDEAALQRCRFDALREIAERVKSRRLPRVDQTTRRSKAVPANACWASALGSGVNAVN